MYKYYFSTYINSLREACLKAVPSNRDFSSYHALNIIAYHIEYTLTL